MSKIYDTLGRKYKDKAANDGMAAQDLGVCFACSRHSVFLIRYYNTKASR